MSDRGADRPPGLVDTGLVDGGDGRTLGFDAAAKRIGAYRWVEHRLFELTGAWAAEPGPPAVQIHLDEASGQHAWHAGLWEERLPVLDRLDHADLTAPSGAAGPLLEAVGAVVPGGGESTAGAFRSDGGGEDGEDGDGSWVPALRRLAALYRVVVPRLLVAYDRHLVRTVSVSDRPTQRALRLVLRDEAETWQAGEALLQSLLQSAADVAVVSEVQADLERLVVEAGGGDDLVGWPPAATLEREQAAPA